jgi:L-ascorbate metabolism protein UlaG (beta-lactamase superfamily)
MQHKFLALVSWVLLCLALPRSPAAAPDPVPGGAVTIRLLRNATLVVGMAGRKILVDPMLAKKGAYAPFPGVANQSRNPLVDLPVSDGELAKILEEIDLVLVTHTHLDHWDPVAQQLLRERQQRRALPIYCQPEDLDTIRAQGLADVRTMADGIRWSGIQIHRTRGRHGLGDLGKQMGPVSGYVLDDGAQRIYIAGDTVWCDEVKDALDTYRPGLAILNAGGAQFDTGPFAGGPITMTPEDVLRVHSNSPDTRIATVHMDTLNHCHIQRRHLRAALGRRQILEMVEIPADGQTIRSPAPQSAQR